MSYLLELDKSQIKILLKLIDYGTGYNFPDNRSKEYVDIIRILKEAIGEE